MISISWKRVLLTNQKERYSNYHRKEEKTKRDIYFEGRSAGFRSLCCELSRQKRSFQLPFNNLSISSIYSSKNIVQTHEIFIQKLSIDFSVAFVEIPSELNPVVIYDAMSVIRSFHSHSTWEDLFKILIKVYKLKESPETILVFDNYTDELEQSFKRTRKIRQGWID